LPQADLAAYQQRAVQARAVGVGPRFATDVVRAMLFTRACGMAVGGSGVSPAVLDALLAMLNAGVHPVVPSLGSIGAADLAPLSHLFLPLQGQGTAEYRGDVLPGVEALAGAGLQPVQLAAKDGIALISANAATVGHAALVLRDCAGRPGRIECCRCADIRGLSRELESAGFRVRRPRIRHQANARPPRD
jgi:histidine ammonia-lyase